MLRSVDSDNNQTEETNMSIENAILELAAAIRHLAASNVGQLQADLKKSQMMVGVHLQEAMESGRKLKEATSDTIEQDVTKVETDAKAEKQSAAKQAIADALELAKAAKAKEAAAAPVVEETDPLLGDGGAAAELDYEKDVKPLLVKVGKDKQQLVELLGKFNAKNGAGIAKADYPAVVAAANKIIGG